MSGVVTAATTMPDAIVDVAVIALIGFIAWLTLRDGDA